MGAEGPHRIVLMCTVLPARSPSIHGSTDAMKLISLQALLTHIPRDRVPMAWETVSPLCLCSELFCWAVLPEGEGSRLELLRAVGQAALQDGSRRETRVRGVSRGCSGLGSSSLGLLLQP